MDNKDDSMYEIKNASPTLVYNLNTNTFCKYLK